MSGVSLLTAISVSCVLATGAMAQIVNNNIPAGASNALSPGRLGATPVVPHSSVPPVTDTAPVTGRSSSCSPGIGCPSVPMLFPRGKR